MGYTVRRWMTCTDQLFDETLRAETAEDAVKCCKKLAGIYNSMINERNSDRIKGLQVGQRVTIREKCLKITILVRRTKY